MMKRPTLPVFNSYHHKDSLLFQFVLHEFLRTIGEVYKLEATIEESDTAEQVHQKLTNYLLNLAGSEQEYVRIFTWIYDAGVLTKLKNTVDLLSQKSDKDDTEMRALHLLVHKSWLECLLSVDLYRNQEFKTLKPQVMKTIKLIRKLPSALKKVIHRFEDDENVLFFLVRHKADFDTLLGKEFLADIINENAIPYLLEKYRGRGFDKLLPQIESLQNVVPAS